MVTCSRAHLVNEGVSVFLDSEEFVSCFNESIAAGALSFYRHVHGFYTAVVSLVPHHRHAFKTHLIE